MHTVVVPRSLAWTVASLPPSISFALIGVVAGEFLGGEWGGSAAIALALRHIGRRLMRGRPESREQA